MESSFEEQASRKTQNSSEIASSSLTFFKENYWKYDIPNIEKIQYSMGYDDDKQLMVICENRFYSCNVCGCKIGSKTTVVQHLKGRQHSTEVKYIVEMFDPISNTWITDSKKPRKDPIIEDTHSSDEKVLSSLDIFKMEYSQLPTEYILNVRYTEKCGRRKFMILCNASKYFCNLCGCHLRGSQNLQQHVQTIAANSNPSVNLILPSEIENDTDTPTKGDQITSLINENDTDSPTKGEQITNEKTISNNTDKPEPTLTQFKTKHSELDLRDLLNILYSTQNERRKYLIIFNNEKYTCSLCDSTVETFSTLKAHISGVEHSKKMQLIDEMYDPKTSLWLKDKVKNGNRAVLHNVCLKQHSTSSNSNLESVVIENDPFYHDVKIDDSLRSLLKFQYRLKNSEEWSFMLTPIIGNYVCNLCGVKRLHSSKNLRSHIRSVAHCERATSTAELFHPDYSLQSLRSNHNNHNKREVAHPKTKNYRSDDFKNFYTNLRTDELLEVQYQIEDGKWQFMLDQTELRYFCRLCGNKELGFANNIKKHVRDENHSKMVQELPGLYHPIYCTFLDDESSSFEEIRKDICERMGSEFRTTHTNNRSVYLIHHPDDFSIFEEFKWNYTDLGRKDLLRIQFQKNDDEWDFMLTEKEDSYFYCNICTIYLQDVENNVESHIVDTQHLEKVSHLIALYHPEYFTFENDEISEGDTSNILDESDDWDPIINQFMMDYVNLESDELMQIEYEMQNGDWEYMFYVRDNQYFCNLCDHISLGTEDDMERHIREEAHINNIKNVSALYHPIYCFDDMECGSKSVSTSDINSSLLSDTIFAVCWTENSSQSSSTSILSEMSLELLNEQRESDSFYSESENLLNEKMNKFFMVTDSVCHYSVLDESSTSDDLSNCDMILGQPPDSEADGLDNVENIKKYAKDLKSFNMYFQQREEDTKNLAALPNPNGSINYTHHNKDNSIISWPLVRIGASEWSDLL